MSIHQMVLYGCEIDESKVVRFDNTLNKKSHDRKRVNFSRKKNIKNFYIDVDEKEMKQNIREVFRIISLSFPFILIKFAFISFDTHNHYFVPDP